MTGINNTTGKSLSGIAHLKQSINDILSTPIGSRVMRREYGSRLFELIDAPLNAETIIDLYAATAEALKRWEPRFELKSVNAYPADCAAGKIELLLVGKYLPSGEDIKLDGIVL